MVVTTGDPPEPVVINSRHIRRPFPSGIRPPADPKGPFDTFSEIYFWPTDPKICLIHTNFEGERAPKKTRFFCQNFSKSAQKRLF